MAQYAEPAPMNLRFFPAKQNFKTPVEAALAASSNLSFDLGGVPLV